MTTESKIFASTLIKKIRSLERRIREIKSERLPDAIKKEWPEGEKRYNLEVLSLQNLIRKNCVMLEFYPAGLAASVSQPESKYIEQMLIDVNIDGRDWDAMGRTDKIEILKRHYATLPKSFKETVALCQSKEEFCKRQFEC